MPTRDACTVALLLALATLGFLSPATAQGPAQDYLYGEQNFSNYCRPPLKYAAGACVRRCPAGYRNRGGRYCSPPGQTGW